MISEYLAKHYINESLNHNLDIKPPRTMFKVIKVELKSVQHLFHSVGIAII